MGPQTTTFLLIQTISNFVKIEIFLVFWKEEVTKVWSIVRKAGQKVLIYENQNFPISATRYLLNCFCSILLVYVTTGEACGFWLKTLNKAFIIHTHTHTHKIVEHYANYFCQQFMAHDIIILSQIIFQTEQTIAIN